MRFKTFTIIISSMIISGCAPSLNSQLANWKQQCIKVIIIHAAATSIGLYCNGYMGASINSMAEAEQTAIRGCNNQQNCTGCYIVARDYANNFTLQIITPVQTMILNFKMKNIREL